MDFNIMNKNSFRYKNKRRTGKLRSFLSPALAALMVFSSLAACTSQSSRFNCIALGAIIMASIIISRLISIIGISLLVLVLLVVLMGVPGMKRDC